MSADEPPKSDSPPEEETAAEATPSRLPAPVKEAIERISPESSGKVKAMVAGSPKPLRNLIFEMAVESDSGPLPPARALEAYQRIDPRFNDAILERFVEQGKLRALEVQQRIKENDRQFELMKADSEAMRALRAYGVWIAAGFGVLGLLATVVLGLKGHDWLAGTVGTTTLGALLAAFAAGNYKDHQDQSMALTHERHMAEMQSARAEDAPGLPAPREESVRAQLAVAHEAPAKPPRKRGKGR